MNAHFLEMFRTAKALHERGNISLKFLFLGNSDYSYEIKICESAGINYDRFPELKNVNKNDNSNILSTYSPLNNNSSLIKKIKLIPVIGNFLVIGRKYFREIVLNKNSVFFYYGILKILKRIF